MDKMIVHIAMLLACTSAHADWTSEQLQDPITDQRKGIVSQILNGGTEAMAVGCGKSVDRKWIDILFLVDAYLGESTTHFVYRFDQDEPKAGIGNNIPSNLGFNLSDSIEQEFLQGMKKSSKLVIRVDRYGDVPKTLVFDLNGFTAAFNKACAGML